MLGKAWRNKRLYDNDHSIEERNVAVKSRIRVGCAVESKMQTIIEFRCQWFKKQRTNSLQHLNNFKQQSEFSRNQKRLRTYSNQ